MKQVMICVAVMAMLSATVGCANGPIRNFLRNSICNRGCEAPPADPSFGFGQVEGCTSCTGAGQAGSFNRGTSYMDDTYIQGDPYINGSNYGGAAINPPVFDDYSGSSYGSTIDPSDSSGTLPVPSGGQ